MQGANGASFPTRSDWSATENSVPAKNDIMTEEMKVGVVVRPKYGGPLMPIMELISDNTTV
jgi:hypothetical protein